MTTLSPDPGAPERAVHPAVGPGEVAWAVDIGGTGIKAALVGADGEVSHHRSVPTPVRREGSQDAVVETVGALAREMGRDAGVEPQRAGVVLPGVVDDEQGIGVFSENLYWHDVPFADRFTAELGVPTRVMHDVRAAGLAECTLGAGSRYRDVMVLTIGTGVAGAIFVDGRPYAGGGYAGEVGHVVVDPDGPECACGLRGCLEAIASAGAFARRYAALTGHDVDGAREVLERARGGDADAERVREEAIDALVVGLAQVSAILAPEAILFAGGLSEAGEDLIGPIRERLDAALTFHRRPVLAQAEIGAHAGLVGAALLTRRS